MTVRISGEVVSGKGVGASFTRTDWAVRIFEEEYGIDPYPGTLNLRVSKTSLSAWHELATHGRTFAAPNPDWCDAKCFAVRIEVGHDQAKGVIVLPMVQGYAPDQIEIVADVNLRSHFAIDDGDRVTLHIQP
jgi:riboflavin kinase, archaea type